MSFIDDGLKKRAELEARASLISNQAPTLYNELWENMQTYVEEAKSKGFEIFIDGGGYKRDIALQLMREGASASHRETFTLDLDVKKEQITAKGQRGVEFTFVLDVSDGGVVCLKHKENPITMEVASILVLQQFLFPGLWA